MDVHYTVMAQDLTTGAFHSFEEAHPMRHFSLPELDLLATDAGFERLTAEEWLTGSEPSEARADSKCVTCSLAGAVSMG
ncbi:hypothetical protein NZK33_19345 [Cyanobium sp. FGCU-6]|nr:hypothetical protein [Cyanobium sp. FGCU6]